MRCTVRFSMTGSCRDAEHGCIARLASVWRRCTRSGWRKSCPSWPTTSSGLPADTHASPRCGSSSERIIRVETRQELGSEAPRVKEHLELARLLFRKAAQEPPAVLALPPEAARADVVPPSGGALCSKS